MLLVSAISVCISICPQRVISRLSAPLNEVRSSLTNGHRGSPTPTFDKCQKATYPLLPRVCSPLRPRALRQRPARQTAHPARSLPRTARPPHKLASGSTRSDEARFTTLQPQGHPAAPSPAGATPPRPAECRPVSRRARAGSPGRPSSRAVDDGHHRHRHFTRPPTDVAAKGYQRRHRQRPGYRHPRTPPARPRRIRPGLSRSA